MPTLQELATANPKLLQPQIIGGSCGNCPRRSIAERNGRNLERFHGNSKDPADQLTQAKNCTNNAIIGIEFTRDHARRIIYTESQVLKRE